MEVCNVYRRFMSYLARAAAILIFETEKNQLSELSPNVSELDSFRKLKDWTVTSAIFATPRHGQRCKLETEK